MSTVKLVTFALFENSKRGVAAGAGPAKPVVGAVASRIGDSGKLELLADSVPFRSRKFDSRKPADGCGMLMLYGVRDTLDEIHHWRTYAREHQLEFASAEYELDVGNIEVGLVNRQTLKEHGTEMAFANLRRMTVSLQSEILHRFSEYAISEGVGIDEEMRRISQIATRPDLFDKLLQDDRELANLSVLVIPVADDPALPGRMRQLAYVRPGVKVVSVVQSNDEVDILLPAWLYDKDVAAKARKSLAAV